MTPEALTLRLLESFLAESQDVAARITRDVLELERGPADEDTRALYQDLSRGLHNLKGSAATIALDDVARLAHDLEEVIGPLAKEGTPLPSAIADRLLADLDAIVGLVRGRLLGAAPVQTVALLGPDSRVAGDGDAIAWRVGADRIRELVREVERLRELHTRLDDRRRQFMLAIGATQRGAAPPDLDRWVSSMIAWAAAIKADSDEAGDVVQGLEVSIKAMCTQQVGAITDPLHRALRDLQRSTGKEARLSVVGAEISLDRRLLDQLRPALVQLVRNAMDHGIELPADRERAGKHRGGLIVIRVEQRGNLVVVEVSDDGKGLDLAAIQRAARRRGLATDEAIARMTADELTALVFSSGFSTQEGAAAISGRGVGLDLVRDQVQALRGRIEVASVAGHGTRFTMTLPSTMGSSPVVLARCGEQEFALPLQSVEAVVAAAPGAVVRGHGGARLDHRGQLLVLEDLGALLGLRAALVEGDGAPVLVVHAQGKRCALRVDGVLGELDLRIHPLPPEIRDSDAYDGAATMPSGALVLAIRPAWLVSARGGIDVGAASPRRALVVDDSLTARAVHRSMLEAGGFTVHAVADAKEALDRLRRTSYDVVVCDVAMEPMSGLAFTAAVRADAKRHAVPVVLVSAHDSPEDRTMAVAAGADGFLSKAECARGHLLAEVGAAIARRREPPS